MVTLFLIKQHFTLLFFTMKTPQPLDVTLIEPRLKHPTIFEYFDALVPDESFIIDNDHDPKPLYYELLAERGDIFTWDYLEKGPERFKVSIRKNKVDPNSSASGAPSTDEQKAQLIKEKGVQFRCGN